MISSYRSVVKQQSVSIYRKKKTYLLNVKYYDKHIMSLYANVHVNLEDLSGCLLSTNQVRFIYHIVL